MVLVQLGQCRQHTQCLDAAPPIRDARKPGAVRGQDIAPYGSDAAQRLGISPRTLRYKLAKLRAGGVSVPAA